MSCDIHVNCRLTGALRPIKTLNLVSCILCEAFWVCTGHIMLKETHKWNQNGLQPLQKHCWVVILSDLLSYLNAHLQKHVSFCHLSGVFHFVFTGKYFWVICFQLRATLRSIKMVDGETIRSSLKLFCWGHYFLVNNSTFFNHLLLCWFFVAREERDLSDLYH